MTKTSRTADHRISRIASAKRARSLLLLLGLGFGASLAAADRGDGLQLYSDPTGIVGVLDKAGDVDPNNPFFQSLGTNGRSCATCHVASQAMSISATEIQARFARTRGTDPLFAPIDGANCPDASQANAAAHSLLLEHGLIRIGLALPAAAQFTLSVVHDPYGCAIMPNPNGGEPIVSVYRRPLPTANLGFLSGVMFDGRETLLPLNSEATFMPNLVSDLTHQALDAITIHAQAAAPPDEEQLTDIVNFELGLFAAQARDDAAGWLRADGASGGVAHLANQEYYPGINDSLGADPEGAAFNAAAMSIFAPWDQLPYQNGNVELREQRRIAARRAIAAGETLFNSAPVHISNVRGLNDNPALNKPTTFVGTCTTCHDTPNTGNHSFPLPLDIGTAHSRLPSLEPDANIAAGLAELSVPDLPVYLISGCADPFNPGQQVSFYTTDPGKALTTGLCSDFNRGKGPILRGLAARAPYFHNGAAANLKELVNFYDQRFQMALTEDQKSDLVEFLNSL
jgi:cytochrome c peroxidase